ncbi:hypothetical protein BBP40_003298 [Aspergillus hancockii]|nr:hypothetical protein BBP40_003298 [Aspergillus hancockii]
MAVEERTGRVKDEEFGGDASLLTQIPNFTNGVLQPSVYKSNGEDHSVHLSQDIADRLVASYISREFANLPFLDLLDFQPAYEAARTEQDIATSPSSFHGILNTIFSLSGLITSEVSDDDVSGLFNRGQIISKDAEKDGSLRERIQLLLLQSQYLYATGNPKLAWMFIGFAIRMAQVLGLHSKAGGQDARGRRDRELARRLWHSAMILERMIALQIGLPPQTSNPLKVPLPTHLDTDYIDLISGAEPTIDAERPSLIEFLTASARLYSYVEDILSWEDDLRMQPNSCAAKKLFAFDFSVFLKVDTLLYEWQTSLPSFLQEENTDNMANDPIVCRQRNALRARHLYVRLRLYRPLLILGLALSAKCNCRPGGRPHATKEEFLSPSSPVFFSMVRDASIKSVTVALQLLNLIQTYENGPLNGSDDSHRSLISPYWENVDYLYACGTVLLAARLCPFIGSHKDSAGTFNEGELKRHLTEVINLLEEYHKSRPSGRMASIAHLCCNTLNDISSAIKGSDINDPSTGAIAVLDGDTRNRLRDRMEIGSPVLNRNRTRQSVENMWGCYGWIESLPIDLAGQLE